MVKEVNGQILREGVEVRRRWAEYFEQVLNVEDVREANINVVGDRMPMLGELNVRAISIEEVKEAVKELHRVRLQVWMDFSGVFKEGWYDSVRIYFETIERILMWE